MKTVKRGGFEIYLLATLAVGGALYNGAHMMWDEHAIDFFKGMLRDPMHVGALSPCSKFVAREITKHVVAFTQKNKTVHVLEIGAGTGEFTRELGRIFEHFDGDYKVDAVEIDRAYGNILQEQFADNDRIAIHCADITQWQTDEKYDVIITSVPFTNLTKEQVKGILRSYERLLKPGGIISYVTLMLFPRLKPRFMWGDAKEDLVEKLDLVDDFVEKYKVETTKVWLNITPVYVHHLQVSE